MSLAATALGATVIEKHLTTDKNLPGPDHKASIDPKELSLMVKGIREIELALGREEKFVHPAEQRNIGPARRSLVAQEPIKADEPFSGSNITSKRPGTGISPMQLWNLLGRKASRAYAKDAPIEPDELK